MINLTHQNELSAKIRQSTLKSQAKKVIREKWYLATKIKK